jgi:hypothetical protein
MANKFRFLVASAGLMTAGAVASSGNANPTEAHLNWGQSLSASDTACPAGSPLINVNQKIFNDIDSGVLGNYWAYDDIVRHITVVSLGGNNYCASVQYQGSFTTVSGFSPGGTGTVAAGVIGTFQGGYTALLTGTFNPAVKTKGSIGTVDYECNASTGICPGYVDWTTQFFTGGASGFNQVWWGWVYHAGNNGNWVNALSGNFGDITGN